MAVRKTHVKSDKRIKREKEQREAAASTSKRQYSKKQKLGSKKKTIVDTRFKVSRIAVFAASIAFFADQF